MKLTQARFFPLLFSLALIAILTDATALIIYDAASTDNSKNVIDPLNSATYPTSPAVGAPWQHVVRYGVNNASAVYIGNGYILTARHVVTSNTGLLIQGVPYARDASFEPLPITIPGSPAILVDMQVQKISGDPGLPVLPMALRSASDLSVNSVLIGCGKGKGSVIPGQGWNWGDDTTRAFRWGTNTTAASAEPLTYTVGPNAMNFTGLSAFFNFDHGKNEAIATNGDSGGALFQFYSAWTLSGLTVTVSTLNSSSYGLNQNSDRTIFVRLREYSWVLRYDAWKAKYSIGAATADSNDADGDGVPLLMEYALGLNPTIRSAEGLPVASVEGTNLVLNYSRLASTTDIKVEIETSSSLQAGDWSVEVPAITVVDGTSVFQKLKASVPLGGADRKFARLKVTRL